MFCLRLSRSLVLSGFKHLGIRFGELDDEQKTCLKYFILHNTVAEV